MMVAIVKAGWATEDSPQAVEPTRIAGRYESLEVLAYKGQKLTPEMIQAAAMRGIKHSYFPAIPVNAKQVFSIKISRRSRTPGPGTVGSKEEAELAPASRRAFVGSNPRVVYVFDEMADVLVHVTPFGRFDAAEVKALFEQLVPAPR